MKKYKFIIEKVLTNTEMPSSDRLYVYSVVWQMKLETVV